MKITDKVIRWMKKENICTKGMIIYEDSFMEDWCHVEQDGKEFTIIWKGHGKYMVIDIDSL